jgi:uncharacterized protein DUF4336
VLRSLGPGIWDSRCHLQTMGPLWVPRRMSVIRLASGDLLLHSPNPLGPELQRSLEELGRVRYLIAPSLMHAGFLEDYLAAFPEAKLYAAPGLSSLEPGLAVEAELGDEDSGSGLPASQSPWADDIDQVLTEGVPRLNEVAFFHRPTRTLILTDYAHNVGSDNPWLTRVVFRAIRGYGRLGPTRYFRSLVEDPGAVWRSIERIARWDFERVLVCHGQETNSSPAQLLQAFSAYRP